MAEINEAWRVLSDSDRRAAYDAVFVAAPPTVRAASNGGPIRNPQQSSSAGGSTTAPVIARYEQPARFPWRFMLVLGSLAIGFILINAAFTKPGKPVAPDNLIEAGSCVNIAENGDAVEVICDGHNQGVVQQLIPFGSVCDQKTESHRDRQGMGQACVLLANTG